MTVRARLVLGFALALVLLTIPGLIALARLAELRDLAVEGRGQQTEASLVLGRMEAYLIELDRRVVTLVALPGDSVNRQSIERTLALLANEEAFLKQTDYRELTGPLSSTLRATIALSEAISETVDEGDLERAESNLSGFSETISGSRRVLVNLARAIDQRAEADFERARTLSAGAARDTAVGIGIGFVLVVLLGAWTSVALSVPLRRLRDAQERVSEGHFEPPAGLPYDRGDEIGDLARSFRSMAARLAELDRLKAEFIGLASHELKTPVNVIRGYAELIEEELAGELTDQQRDILLRIEEQTGVLSRQVSRLMDISRLESGGFRMDPERIRLDDLLMGLVRSHEVIALQKSIDIRTELDEETSGSIMVDVDLIRDDVLGNLVSNALKFTPPGGTVTIRARFEGTEAVIEIEDDGPGIAVEHRDHIFAKYYQVERSRAMGSGLGLAIAKEIVEAAGGSIRLLDRGPPGATFEVRLPRAAPSVAEPRRQVVAT